MLALAPLSLAWFKEVVAVADLAKTLAGKIKSKLEQYCKGSKENNKKLLVQ